MDTSTTLSEIDPFLNTNAVQAVAQDNLLFSQGNQSLSNIDTLSVGFGTKVLRTDKQGLWLGSDKFTTAPFSVSMDGTITAKRGVLELDLNIGGINNQNGVLRIFDASNIEQAQADKTGFTVFGLSSINFAATIADGGAIYGTIGANVSLNALSMEAIVGVGINLSGQSLSVHTLPFDTGNIDFYGNVTTHGNLSTTGSFNPSSVTTNTVHINNHFGLSIAGNDFDVDHGTAWIDNAGGTVFISSGGFVKTAVIPTSQGFNELYAVESPEVWFFDFAKDKDSIDPLFMEVTEGEIKTVKTEEGELLIFHHRKDTADRRFRKVDIQAFNSNNKFWSGQRA